MNLTVVVPRKHHSLPKCMVPVIEALENLDGVVRVGVGSFGNMGKNIFNFTWSPHYMDERTQTVKINIRYQEFSQDLHITVRHGHLSTLANFLNNYKP